MDTNQHKWNGRGTSRVGRSARKLPAALSCAVLTAAVPGLLVLPGVASACSTCFGDPESPLTKGADAGIIFLLIVIGTVLSAFASLFAYWMHRHRVNERLTADGVVQ